MIAIAISGGIDSLVAAYLLREVGHEVFGIHFITGYETGDLRQIEAIGNHLGITVRTIDCAREFYSCVVKYFIRTYQDGQTPNPCLVCNSAVKFGPVLAAARELGASGLCTGHYARIIKDDTGLYHLHKGIDPQKDQSYFLAFLSQKQLSRASFPLGKMNKTEVIKLAKEKGIRTLARSESQDVCFIRGMTYSEFIIREGKFEPEPGPIEDVNGVLLGQHTGLHLFTIGQRRGINCPGPAPYYVVDTDSTRNCLIVGCKKDLLSSECRVTGINWIASEPAAPIKVDTRLRYRHKGARSTLFPLDHCTVMVRFDDPQPAITPGQGAVFYREDEVLGGGWIEGKRRKIRG